MPSSWPTVLPRTPSRWQARPAAPPPPNLKISPLGAGSRIRASAHSLGREAMATDVIVRPREGLSDEQNGINVISSGERKGSPRDLLWPWCAANIAVLGISYGSFFLGFGVSFWQATIAGVVGTVLSF